jgi:hypothetical protein
MGARARNAIRDGGKCVPVCDMPSLRYSGAYFGYCPQKGRGKQRATGMDYTRAGTGLDGFLSPDAARGFLDVRSLVGVVGVLDSSLPGLGNGSPEVYFSMIITLPPAVRTIRLAPAKTYISLDSPLRTTITNYRDLLILVNQNGDTLVNQNGDALAAIFVRSARTNVINLGA